MGVITADRIREFARLEYIEPARRRGAATVRVVVGDVHRSLKLKNLAPSVSSALLSRKFLHSNQLELAEPPSGRSTRSAYTYRLLDGNGLPSGQESSPSNFYKYRGVGKELFAKLGGGETFIRKERAAWGRGE